MSWSTIGSTSIRLPAADLGPDSPLPAFVGLQRLPDPSLLPGLPPEMRDRIAYGRLANPLPYPLQDGYERKLRLNDLPALRLGNDRLEALVLPQLGGRVWSLRDLGTGRDLIFANPRLVFANLALTGAWFAGGIEWNLGSTGHAATTCRPVFVGRVETERGPLLRLWEWERTRDLVFQVDLMIPEDSPVLLAFIRVRNPDAVPKPLYWWTNTAAAETPGVRVLAPATRAWRTAYDGSVASVEMPFPDSADVDVSNPLRAERAADYFFEIPADRRGWIAAVEADGRGVVQTATDAMTGRKLFVWGTAAGGRRWQEWLAEVDRRYLEIQAGLAATQLEHLRIDGGGQVSWVEAYAPLHADPVRAHGSWAEAIAEVDQRLDQMTPAADLQDWHAWWRDEVADRAISEQLADGSGAGQAELVIRGIGPDDLSGTPFSDPLGDGFRHLTRLAAGEPIDHDEVGRDLLVPPITGRWRPVFDRAADGWWGQLMIAIREHAAGRLDQAEYGYRRSHEFAATAWADRGLALVADARGETDTAAGHYLAAFAQAPGCLPLLVEASDHLLRVDRPEDCLRLIDSAPAALAAHGRVLLQRVRAYLACGQPASARMLLDAGLEVPDLREGETLDRLWREAYGDRDLPVRYDFRMHEDTKDTSGARSD
jgi:hypothetical protein